MSDIGLLWTGLGLSWCIILYLERKYRQVQNENIKLEMEISNYEITKYLRQEKT